MSYKATNWAYEMKLTSPMKPVLVALADMADEQASCFPGQEKIAAMTGLSVATVRRALVKLEGLGLISRQRRYDQFGHRTSDRYVLHLSVGVTESLPLTLPTRQRAYKSHSQSLPLTQSIPTAHSARVTISEPSEEPSGGPLEPFCSNHMPSGPGGRSCRACGDAKRAYDFAAKQKAERPTPAPPKRDVTACKFHEWLPAEGCSECARLEAVAS